MSFTRWLSNRLGLSRRPVSRMQRPAARPRFRPMLEGLEDRWMPSTLTVSNNLDSGPGSLRADIAAAHSGDTINFASSLDGQTITLTSGELLIRKNLTFIGPGASQLTVSGNNLSRVFEVTKVAAVALSGLTISNGLVQSISSSGWGGGIANHGALTVSGCTVSGNSATNGGGIWNDVNGTLAVNGSSTVSYNTASKSDGGGIYNTGTLTVNNCTVSFNTCNNSGGGIENEGTLTVSNCTLSNNTASAQGGGVRNSGTLTVSGSTLSGNTGGYGGGGVFNSGALAVSNSALSGNTAVAGRGGGIWDDGTASVTGCTLSGNSAGTGGGGGGGGIFVDTYAMLTVSGSTLSNNTTPHHGGAIWVHAGGTLTVKNSSSITGNTAPLGFGADVYNFGVLYLDNSSIIGILDGNPAVPI